MEHERNRMHKDIHNQDKLHQRQLLAQQISCHNDIQHSQDHNKEQLPGLQGQDLG